MPTNVSADLIDPGPLSLLVKGGGDALPAIKRQSFAKETDSDTFTGEISPLSDALLPELRRRKAGRLFERCRAMFRLPESYRQRDLSDVVIGAAAGEASMDPCLWLPSARRPHDRRH